MPLFWLALLGEEDVTAWAGAVRAAFGDAEGGTAIPPILLPWPLAHDRLRAAAARAPERVPGWAGWFAAWAAALDTRAEAGDAHQVRLDMAEIANFHDDADAFLTEVQRGIRLWHGAGAPDPPTIAYPAVELSGFDEATGETFPPGIPLRSDPATGGTDEGRGPAAPPPAVRRRHAWLWALAAAGVAAAVVLTQFW